MEPASPSLSLLWDHLPADWRKTEVTEARDNQAKSWSLENPGPGTVAWMFSNAFEMGVLVWPSSPLLVSFRDLNVVLL